METPFGPFTGTSFNVAAFAYSSRYLSNPESIFVFKPFIVKYGTAEAAAGASDARAAAAGAEAGASDARAASAAAAEAASAAEAAAEAAVGFWIIGSGGGEGRNDSGSGGPGGGGSGGNGGGRSIDAIILLYYLGLCDIISILPSLYTSYKNVCYVRTLGVMCYSFLAYIRRRRLKCIILKELMILHQL